jgi:hypothetical protein
MSMTLHVDVLGKTFLSHTFVETGTFDGRGAVFAVYSGFKRVYTIEVDSVRAALARKRIMGFPEIMILEGDTIDVLPKVLVDLDDRATIFLDAHPIGFGDPSKGGRLKYPLVEELNLIEKRSKRRDHLILIDDINALAHFGTSNDEVKEMLLKINPKYQVGLYPNCRGQLDMIGALPA